jgi:hypothetical protein
LGRRQVEAEVEHEPREGTSLGSECENRTLSSRGCDEPRIRLDRLGLKTWQREGEDRPEMRSGSFGQTRLCFPLSYGCAADGDGETSTQSRPSLRRLPPALPPFPAASLVCLEMRGGSRRDAGLLNRQRGSKSRRRRCGLGDDGVEVFGLDGSRGESRERYWRDVRYLGHGDVGRWGAWSACGEKRRKRKEESWAANERESWSQLREQGKTSSCKSRMQGRAEWDRAQDLPCKIEKQRQEGDGGVSTSYNGKHSKLKRDEGNVHLVPHTMAVDAQMVGVIEGVQGRGLRERVRSW